MFIRPTAIFTAASRAARTQVLARGYASALSRDDIQSRVLDVVKGFDKVDASKVNKSWPAFRVPLLLTTHFCIYAF